MNDSSRDATVHAELIAAVLDGRASPLEREELMQRMARSRSVHASFVSAMQLRDEMASASGASQRPALTLVKGSAEPERRTSRMLTPLLAVAAAMAFVALLKWPARQTSDVLVLAQSTRVTGASGSGSMALALGAQWDAPAWNVVRGADHGRTPVARAYRAGVYVAQLESAMNAMDSSAVQGAVQQLQALLLDRDGSGPIAAQLALIAGPARVIDANSRRTVAGQVRTLLGEPTWFDLGVWTEAARLAAMNGQSHFFADGGEPMLQLAALLQRSAAPIDGWQSATAPLRTLPRQLHESDLSRVLMLLGQVMTAAGS